MPGYADPAAYAASQMSSPPSSSPLPAPRRMPGAGDYDVTVENARKAMETYRNGFAASSQGQALRAGGSPAYYEAALQSDPQFQKLQKAHQDAQAGHVYGQTPQEYQLGQAVVLGAGNQARAVETDAGTRRMVGEGEANRTTGLGNLSNAQAGNISALTPVQIRQGTADAHRTEQLTPEMVAAQHAATAAQYQETEKNRQLLPGQVQAQQVGNQGAAAAIPGNVAGQAAGNRKTSAEAGLIEGQTKVLPAITDAQLAAAAAARQMDASLKQSEVNKNNSEAGMLPGAQQIQQRAAAEQDYKNSRSLPRALWEDWIAGRPAGVGAASVNPAAGVPGASGSVGPGGVVAAPTAAPVRKQLPDGRVIEQVGNLVYQIMPDGSRKVLNVAPQQPLQFSH